MHKKVFLAGAVIMLALANFAGFGNPEVVQAQTKPLVISAVQTTGGDGFSNQDFIEIFNPNPDPFNLNGVRLVKRSSTAITDSSIKSWSTDTFIPAYGFFLWANSTFDTISSVPDVTTSSTIADNNGVALRFGPMDTGEIIDSVSWGTTDNGFAPSGLENPAANSSITRQSLFDNMGYELTASNPRNSQVIELPPDPTPVPDPDPTPLPDPDPTPEPTPDPDPTPDPVPDPEPVPDPVPTPEPSPAQYNVMITELLPNPNGKDLGQEVVELYNEGPDAADLAGWILDDVLPNEAISADHYELEQIILPPKSYISVTIPSNKFAMNNSKGETITLFDTDGVADSVSYPANTPSGKTYSLSSDEWSWGESTLGKANQDNVKKKKKFHQIIRKIQKRLCTQSKVCNSPKFIQHHRVGKLSS